MNVSRCTTDVFIIGGGPAGLPVSIAARQKGFQVTVADGIAPPIQKPCGEGMLPETLAALRGLGVEIDPADGARLRGICFVQDCARVWSDFPGELGVGLRRTVLHERLVARAQEAGVQLLWRTPISGIDADAVQLTHGKIYAHWIVGADGQGSRVRHRSGIETKTVKQRHAIRRHYRVKPWSSYVEVHWGTRAQAYVTPVGEEEVCIVILSVTPEYASFDKALCEFPALREKLSGAQLNSRERGAVTCMRTLSNVLRRNVALVGDASGGVDAITGDGIRLALRQASALVEAMAADDLEQYEQEHHKLAKGATRMRNLMLWLDRNPRLRRRVIHAWDFRACWQGARNSGGFVFDGSTTRLAAADYLRKAVVQSELLPELQYSLLAVQFRWSSEPLREFRNAVLKRPRMVQLGVVVLIAGWVIPYYILLHAGLQAAWLSVSLFSCVIAA